MIHGLHGMHVLWSCSLIETFQNPISLNPNIYTGWDPFRGVGTDDAFIYVMVRLAGPLPERIGTRTVSASQTVGSHACRD